MKMSRAGIAQVLLFVLLAPCAGFAQSKKLAVPPLQKIIWIWLENTSYSEMSRQNYSRYLSANFPSVIFSAYSAPHTSTQANAMTLIGGTDFGIQDNLLTRINSPTLIDLLDAKNLSWKVYAEDFPGACYLSEGTANYKRYRVPFLSIASIQEDRYRCMKIVGFSNLADDIRYGTLPDFTVLIPNLKSSGATSDPLTADNTLLRLLEPVMYNPELLRDTTIVISTLNHSVNAESEVFTMMLGQGIGSMGMNVSTPYSHLNLLRTFEDGLSLGTLNQGDAVAPPMVGFWK